MNVKTIDDKLEFLITEKKNNIKIKEISPFYEKDAISIREIFNYIENKKFKTCENQYSELSKYSSNLFNKHENFNNAYANKDKQKEFNEAKIKLIQCFQPYDEISEQLKNNLFFFENITMQSFGMCINDIKKEIKEKKINENQVRMKIDRCFYSYLNSLNTNNKLVNELIKSIKQNY